MQNWWGLLIVIGALWLYVTILVETSFKIAWTKKPKPHYQKDRWQEQMAAAKKVSKTTQERKETQMPNEPEPMLVKSLQELQAAYGLGQIFSALAKIQELPYSKFPSELAQHFHELDHESGAHNWVNLVSLRERMSDWPKKVFDAELLSLKTYTLAAVDPRYVLSDLERAAIIRHQGHDMLFVSRVRTAAQPEVDIRRVVLSDPRKKTMEAINLDNNSH